MNELEFEQTLDIIFEAPKVPQKWDAVNRLESYIATLPRVSGSVVERGTPGLYTREIFMPTGMLCTSRIHKTQHQFIVSQGSVTVYNTLTDTTELIIAPYHGITMPGTRRCLYIHSDCVWCTAHPTDRIKTGFDLLPIQEQEVIFGDVMNDLIQEYYNPLLTNFDEGVFI